MLAFILTCINSSMSDDLDIIISKIVLDLMIEARDQGYSLSYHDICRMIGIPEKAIEDDSKENEMFTLNEDFINATQDKEIRRAMIEKAFSKIH